MKFPAFILITAILFALVLGLLAAGCETGDDDDDSPAQFGKILGMVVDSFHGDPVVEAKIKVILNAKGWSTTLSDANGIFEFHNIPVASDLYLEFEKDDFCPMYFMLDTIVAQHSGSLTNIFLEVHHADAILKVAVTGNGEFISGHQVAIRPVSYDYIAVSSITNDFGDTSFSVSQLQAYEIYVPPFDYDKDGENDFEALAKTITITSDSEHVYMNLQPKDKGQMELISVGANGTTGLAYFSEPIYSFELFSGSTPNATFGSPPAAVSLQGNQAIMVPNITSGTIEHGDEVVFSAKVSGSRSGTAFTGAIRYIADMGEGPADDDDDDDTDTCQYEEDFNWLYHDCSYAIYEGGGYLTIEQVIAQCDSCYGQCSAAYSSRNNCQGAIDCIVGICQ